MSGFPAEKRYAALDGLRAVAILLVVALHVAHPLYLVLGDSFVPLGSVPFTWFLLNGWVGVQLFFVLSGFLITGQLLSLERSDDARYQVFHFWKKRFFRIAPAYYIILILLCLTVAVETPAPDAADLYGLTGQFLSHALFMQDTYPVNLPHVFYLWSLATEMKFYALSPFIVMGLLRLREAARLPVLASIIMILLALKVIIFIEYGPAPTQLAFFLDIRRPFYMAIDSLMVGMICQCAWQNRHIRDLLTRKIWSFSLLYGGIGLAVALMAFTHPYLDNTGAGLGFFQHTFFFTLIAIAFGMILLGLICGAQGAGLFECGFLGKISTISYSLYLIHPLLVTVSISLVQLLVPYMSSPFLIWLFSFAVVLILSAGPSLLLYHYVEKRFIIWSKRPSDKKRT